MKIYFALLSLLFASSAATRIAQLMRPGGPFADPYHIIKYAADIVLFAAALYGAYLHGWGKREGSIVLWGWIKNLLLALGAFSVIAAGFPEALGVPGTPQRPGLLRLFLLFLPYILFAVPVVLLEKEMRDERQGI